MSMEMIAQVLRLSKSTGSAQKLLLVIAYHMNHETGLACPSRRLLATELRVSERHIKRLLHTLFKLGELDIRHGQGRGHLSTYHIRLDPTEVIHRKGDIPKQGATPKRGHVGSEQRGHSGSAVEPKERNPDQPRSLPDTTTGLWPSYDAQPPPEVARRWLKNLAWLGLGESPA
jgi:hypothetical protein